MVTIYQNQLPTKTNINFAIRKVYKDLNLTNSDLIFLEELLSNLKKSQIDLKNFIVTPSNDFLKRTLKVSSRTIQRKVKNLIKAGLIIYKRSPIGRRFVRHKNIYGFDLSPLFYRYDEFLALIKKAKDEYHISKAKIALKTENKNHSQISDILEKIDQKTVDNCQEVCEKSYPQNDKIVALTNNIKFKKEIKNKEKIISLFQEIGFRSLYDKSFIFELIGIKKFNSWNDVLASTKSIFMILQVNNQKIDSLFSQYDYFELFIISFLTAKKYEQQEITSPTKFINQFFYNSKLNVFDEIKKVLN